MSGNQWYLVSLACYAAGIIFIYRK